MMAEAESERLTILREAAAGRDWGLLQDTLAGLLGAMEYFYGLEIALKRAYDFLPIFEQHHPQDGWARSLLVWLASYGVAPANLPVEAGQPHQSPGAANYVSALIELARSAERQTPLENRIRFLANAIGNLIVADLAAFWYSLHPDKWRLQQQHGDELDPATGQTVRQGIYAHFWLDEVAAARDTAAWLSVAEAVERKLK
jgi:hypothetical protein